ncbi:hypothetical protein K8353_26000 [Burkholderia contaminans]|nr:hypothetical protein [Burkholderia contaminans]
MPRAHAPPDAAPLRIAATRASVDRISCAKVGLLISCAACSASCVMSDDELHVVFAAMVGANLLARDRRLEWATEVERALVDRLRDA